MPSLVVIGSQIKEKQRGVPPSSLYGSKRPQHEEGKVMNRSELKYFINTCLKNPVWYFTVEI